MTDKTDEQKTPPAGSAPASPPPAPKPEEAKAVLLKFVDDLPPGKIVRGAADQIKALVTAGKARPATAQDLGIAGGRTVALRRV